MSAVIDLLNVKAKLFVASTILPATSAKYARKQPKIVLRRLRNAAYHAQAGTESAAVEFPAEMADAVAFIRADERLMDALNSPTLA